MPVSFGEIPGLDVYTSSPSERALTTAQFLARLRTVARWSDDHGCRGMLIYTDNRSLDPWVMADDVIAHTRALSPLIAVQPVYMHPYAAAQKVGTIAQLYDRSVDLNFVAGGFKFDLAALDDRVAHDDRYARLSEYGEVLARLVRGERVTFQGRFYSVFGLKLESHAPAHVQPRLTVSGSSPAGLACADAIGATAVMYPQPLEQPEPDLVQTAPTSSGATASRRTGIRIGLLARATSEEAWLTAARRFPEDATAQGWTKAAVQTSDSSWMRQLGALTTEYGTAGRSVYWTGPFANGRSFCPYLVGSYDEVAAYLSVYLRRDVRLIILDCPTDEDDLRHAHAAIRRSVSSLVPEA